MIASSELFRAAAKRALKVRTEAGYALAQACDVYQLISGHRMELQFFSVPTLEGMYLEDGETRRICVSAFRPPGRQRFTAAHECGHSFLGHGTKVDTIEELREITSDRDVDERLANTFASSLMMPNSAVNSGFRLRGIDVTKCTATQCYGVATWLGVGYSTLSQHLFYSMELISREHLRQLLREEPKTIKSEIIHQETTNEVFELDRLWDQGCIYAQVGDFFTGIGSCRDILLTKVREGLFNAKEPGQTTVTTVSGGLVRIKIARENYVGFYEYRHLPEEN
jgi:hypothetical protein